MSKPSFQLKIERANGYFEEIKTRISEFLDPNDKPYEVSPDEHGEPDKLRFWITLRKEPPDEIRLLLGRLGGT